MRLRPPDPLQEVLQLAVIGPLVLPKTRISGLFS